MTDAGQMPANRSTTRSAAGHATVCSANTRLMDILVHTTTQLLMLAKLTDDIQF